jgi:hypothetical protein
VGLRLGQMTYARAVVRHWNERGRCMPDLRIVFQRPPSAYVSHELGEANDRAARVAWHLSKLRRDIAVIEGDMVPRALVEEHISAAMREG